MRLYASYKYLIFVILIIFHNQSLSQKEVVQDSTFKEKVSFCLAAIENKEYQGVLIYADDIILEICTPSKYHPDDVLYYFSQNVSAASPHEQAGVCKPPRYSYMQPWPG